MLVHDWLDLNLKENLLKVALHSVMSEFSAYVKIYPEKLFMPVWPLGHGADGEDTKPWVNFEGLAQSSLNRKFSDGWLPPSQKDSILVQQKHTVRLKR